MKKFPFRQFAAFALCIPLILTILPSCSLGGSDDVTSEQPIAIDTKQETTSAMNTESATIPAATAPAQSFVQQRPDIMKLLGLDSSNTAAYWTFEGAAGGEIKDLSGSGADFPLTAGKAGDGIYGGGLTLTSDQTLTVDTSAKLSGFDTMTVSFWLRLDTLPSGNAMILGKDSKPPYDYRMVLTGAGGGDAVVSSKNSQWYQGNACPFLGDVFVNLTDWTMLTFTYDGSVIRTYVNGEFDSATTAGAMGGPVNNTTAKLYFGQDIQDGVAGFDGTVDEMLILKKALSDGDIASLYGAYTGKTAGGAAGNVKFTPDTSDFQIAAYYFPQWHVDPSNAAYFGYDWTEWETLKAALPKFPGHDQPKVPLWGYGNEADPAVMEQKIDAAANASVNAFIFDWYYSDNGPFLQGALEDGYLKSDNKDKVKFALMWANHDIITGPGIVKPETWDSLCDYVIKNYFHDPDYWRVDGGLYFSIYEVQDFLATFGDDVNKTAAALESFRQKTKDAGCGELHINLVDYGLGQLPADVKAQVTSKNDLIAKLGVDSVTSYVWVHHTAIPSFPSYDYADYMPAAVNDEEKLGQSYAVPYFPNASMGWDSTPRMVQDPNAPFENTGYPAGPVLVDNTPALFQQALERLKTDCRAGGFQQNIITINSWNEWTEGSYLEPDTKNGYGYLDAIHAVFG